MAIVQENRIRLKVGSTLTQSVVSNVKAAGDTGILKDVDTKLAEIRQGVQDELPQDILAKTNTIVSNIDNLARENRGQYNDLDDAIDAIGEKVDQKSADIIRNIANIDNGIDTVIMQGAETGNKVDAVNYKLDHLNIDFTPVERKVDAVKADTAYIKGKIDQGGGGGGSDPRVLASLGEDAEGETVHEKLDRLDGEIDDTIGRDADGNTLHTKADYLNINLKAVQENLAQKIDDIDVDFTPIEKSIGRDAGGVTLHQKADTFAQELDKIGSPAEGQPNTLFAAIAAGGGGGSEDVMAKLNEIEKALKKADVQSSFEGYKFEDGFNSLSLLDFLRVANDKTIVEIYDDSATKISTEQFVSLAANATAKKVTFTKVVETYLSNPILDVFGGQSNNVLEELNLPKLSIGGSYGYLRYYSALKRVSIPNLSNIYDQDTYSFISATNLIDIEFGKAVTGNVNFLQRWSPTNALLSNSSNLVDEGEPFASNLEKLLYNIREHIAANLPSISATIKFSAAVKAAILADAATASAFTSKGWTIA